MLVRSLIALLFVLPSSIVAKQHQGIKRLSLERRQADPSQDDFYQAPANLKTLKAGAVIRSRAVTIPNAPLESTAYQILFRSASPNGTALAAATTLLLPNGPDLSRLISYSLAQDGSNVKCAPSYVLPTGYAAEQAFVQGFMNRRWPITVADYWGPDAAYTAGRLGGQITLDAIRATLAFKTEGFTGFKSDARVGLIGYSSGAQPVGWAASLAPTYAKELNLVGAAFGGAPTNLPLAISYLDASPGAGFVFGSVLGLSKTYSAFANRLSQILTPAGQDALAKTATQCSGDNLNSFANETFRSTKYQRLGPLFVLDPVIGNVYQQHVLGQKTSETPQIPLLVVHATNDKIVPIQLVEGTVQSWCWKGIKSLEFVRNYGKTDHLTQYLLSLADILNFIGARFNGDAPAQGCKNRYVNYSLGRKRHEITELEDAHLLE